VKQTGGAYRVRRRVVKRAGSCYQMSGIVDHNAIIL
jgi:hypothetical protein